MTTTNYVHADCCSITTVKGKVSKDAACHRFYEDCFLVR